MIQFVNIPKYYLVPPSEKEKIIKTIKLIKYLAEKARREGILALEEEIVTNSQLQYNLAQTLLSMVVDGMDPKTIEIFGLHIIDSTACSDSEKLLFMITLNGMLGIQEGYNPKVIVTLLLSMLGMENFLAMQNDFFEDEPLAADYSKNFAKIEVEEEVSLNSDVTAEKQNPSKIITTEPNVKPEELKAIVAKMIDHRQQKLMDLIAVDFKSFLAEIAAYLPEEKAEEALKKLNPEVSKDVAELRKQMLEAGIDVKNFIETIFSQEDMDSMDELMDEFQEASKEYTHAEIMNILNESCKSDKLLAEYIDDKIFTFNDITLLSDSDIQKLLREIDIIEITLALKLADEETINKIEKNLSKRTYNMIKEEDACLGSVSKKRILEVQQKIVAIIKRLDDIGEIIIPNKSDFDISI